MITRIKLDKERPIIFGMNAHNLMCEDFGCTITGLMAIAADPTPLQFTKMVYYGLKDGARRDKSEFELNLEETADLLDDPDTALKAFEIFLNQGSDGTKVKGKKPKGSS